MKYLRYAAAAGCLFGLIAATALGANFYGRFPFAVYFWVPFAFIALVAAAPFGLLWLLLYLESWRSRGVALAVTALLIAGIWFGPSMYRAALEEPGNQGPYLSWKSDPATTMTVSWTTAEPAPSVVMVRGPGDEAFRTVMDDSPRRIHHVTVDGLSPGTGYEYSVPSLKKGLLVLHTAPDVDSGEFSFVVYGDNRPWGGLSLHDEVFAAMRKHYDESPYAFIINTGDVVENPGQGYGWQWRQFLDTITPLASKIPYFVSLGNHEARGTTRFFEEYFAFADEQLWYSFSYQGVLFVMLSSEHDLAPGYEQYAWLEETLATEGPDHRYQIVALHRPIITYDPRPRYRDTSRREHLSPLFQEHGVDLVLAGHVHAYEHHIVDGYHHVVTGGGGVLLWNVPETGPETVTTETTFHYCVVEVTDAGMQVTAYRMDGSVIESFTVEPRSARQVMARSRKTR